MSLSSQLLALADVLEEEGGVASPAALREAVELLDERDELLDRIDDLERGLQEEKIAHRKTATSLRSYQDAMQTFVERIPQEDVANMVDRRNFRNRQYYYPPPYTFDQKNVLDIKP